MASMSEKDTYTNNINDADGRDNGTEPSGHGSAASSEHDGNAASPEHDNEAAEQRDGVGDVSSERENAAIADKEAASRSNHAEEAPLDERSAAHAAEAASDKHHAAHAAKATPIEHRTSRATETASAYLKKAGNFLGLHKKSFRHRCSRCAVRRSGHRRSRGFKQPARP